MRPRTFIFSVAIENYQDDSLPDALYVEQDAQEFVDAWKELGAAPDDCVVLLSDQATLESIRSGLKKMVKALQPEDRLIVYYAGHGGDVAGTGVLTAFDTRADTVEKTTIPFSEFLSEIRQAKCSSTLLFLDSSFSDAPIFTDVSVSETGVSHNELRAFCKESVQHFAFISCKPKELSHPSRTLDHGIWCHCLIQAIKGLAKEAIGKDQRVTTTSLQSYLLAEVPRLLRVTVAGAVKQTPVMFGSKAKEAIVVDLAELPSRQLAVVGASNPIKDSCLTGEYRGRVRDLKGYSKPKASLGTHNDWERDFVEKAGASEVSLLATEIFEQLRECFRYKRKDLSFTNIASTASIKGPDFDVNISLSQDPEDAERYLLKTEVRSFRNPDIIDDPNFLAIFSKYCKRIVFELEASLDLESKIDDIEEIDALASKLEYDPECTEFTLHLPEPGIVIHATGSEMVFTLDSQGDLKLLLGNTQKAFAQLAGNSINLGVRQTRT